jgi:hypothetical protein
MTMPRAKKPLNLYVDPYLLALFEEWVATQEPPPSKTAALELALREFLAKRGMLPAKER